MSVGVIHEVFGEFNRAHGRRCERLGIITTQENVDTYRIQSLALAGCANATEIVVAERKSVGVSGVKAIRIDPIAFVETLAGDMEMHVGSELSDAAQMELALLREDPQLCVAEWR